MKRTTVIPTKKEDQQLLESDKSSEEHSSMNSAIFVERSAVSIVGSGDVELSEFKPEGKEKENSNGGGVIVKGIRRRDNPLQPHHHTPEITRSNKMAVQKEIIVSLFDFALSFRPKGEEWRSQRRYFFFRRYFHLLYPDITFPLPCSSDTPESIHALFYGNLAQSNEEATKMSDRVQLNIERSIIQTSGSQQL